MLGGALQQQDTRGVVPGGQRRAESSVAAPHDNHVIHGHSHGGSARLPPALQFLAQGLRKLGHDPVCFVLDNTVPERP